MFKQLLRLSKHSIIYGFGMAASQIVAFFLLPLYTRYLTLEDYGILEIFSVTHMILGIILIMGLSTALFRFYFDYEDEQNRQKVLSTALIFTTATSLFFTLLLMLLASNLSLLLFDSNQYAFYFRVIFLTVFFDAAIMLLFAVLRAREESKKYAAVSLARVLVSMGLNIYFVVALGKGVLGILESHLITVALLYFLLMPGIIKRTKLGFSTGDLKRMLSFGLPLVPASLAAWVMTLADRYFLQFLSTPQELGLYSVGYKFGMVVQGLIVAPFGLAWAPFIYSIAKEKNAKEVYSSVLTYFTLVVMFVALGLSVLSKEVLMIMATPPFYGAYKIIPLIALSYVLYGCSNILGVGIGLERKTKFRPLIVGVGAAVNLGLNYLLIPSYGMMGAAVATLISYLLLPIGSYFVSRRYYPIKYEWVRVAKVFVAATLVYVGTTFITTDSALISGVFKLISLLGFPLLLFAFKFFKPEEIKKAKEIIRIAPGYIRLRLAQNRMSRKK